MTPTEFRTLMPQFSGVGDSDIQRWLNKAPPYLDVARADDLYPDGLSNFVAWGLVDEGTAAGVPLTPNVSNFATLKKVGTEQVGYSEAMMKLVAEDPFMSNKYGRRFRAIAREVGRGAAVA